MLTLYMYLSQGRAEESCQLLFSRPVVLFMLSRPDRLQSGHSCLGRFAQDRDEAVATSTMSYHNGQDRGREHPAPIAPVPDLRTCVFNLLHHASFLDELPSAPEPAYGLAESHPDGSANPTTWALPPL